MNNTIKGILEYLVSKEIAELRHKKRDEFDEDARNEIQTEIDYLSDLFDKLTEMETIDE